MMAKVIKIKAVVTMMKIIIAIPTARTTKSTATINNDGDNNDKK